MQALPSVFCPSTTYIAAIISQPNAVIYTGETYQKQTLRNRCTLLTANGVADFSIPVQKYAHPTPPTSEILISEHGGWRHRLDQTLLSSYGTAPFWEHYAEEIRALIYDDSEETLVGYNNRWLTFICHVLGVPTPPSSKVLSDGVVFKPEYGDTRFVSKTPMPRYWQVFEQRFGFTSSLSALDLILCEGPYARSEELWPDSFRNTDR